MANILSQHLWVYTGTYDTYYTYYEVAALRLLLRSARWRSGHVGRWRWEVQGSGRSPQVNKLVYIICQISRQFMLYKS